MQYNNKGTQGFAIAGASHASENMYPFRALIASHRTAHPRGSERVHVEGSAAWNTCTWGGGTEVHGKPAGILHGHCMRLHGTAQ